MSSPVVLLVLLVGLLGVGAWRQRRRPVRIANGTPAPVPAADSDPTV